MLLSVTPVLADDGFYVIGGGGVGTKITSLPYTIEKPGFYYLGGNLQLTTFAHGAGITVNCSHVTIDLMGFKLSHENINGYYFTGTGISLNGREDVEIRNGTLMGGGEGHR
jgi:hypothetical protein